MVIWNWIHVSPIVNDVPGRPNVRQVLVQGNAVKLIARLLQGTVIGLAVSSTTSAWSHASYPRWQVWSRWSQAKPSHRRWITRSTSKSTWLSWLLSQSHTLGRYGRWYSQTSISGHSVARSPALIRSARRVLNNRTLRAIHYYRDYAVTSIIRIMAAQSRPTCNCMYINTLDNTANTNELPLFTTCYAPASMIWLAIATCLAMQYNWHRTNTRLSHAYLSSC